MGNVEIPNWLEGLPMAPVFRPTDTEFADPVAYISKIEKEASAFGICKIIPPLPRPSKKYVFSNLNKSLSKCPDIGPDVSLSSLGYFSKTGPGNCGKDGEVRAVFTTRQQELGQNIKRPKGVGNNPPPLHGHKQVWQSGEAYTLEQFEAKSKAFSRTLLGMVKEVSPLVVEALFWKAAKEKPIYVEYANDVPGSGFGEPERPFQYLQRQRRMRSRTSYQRRSCKDEARHVSDPCGYNSCENKGACTGSSTSIPLEKCNQSGTPLEAPSLDQSLTVHRKSNSSAGYSNSEKEGSAGWKLSNSPWNLQVIARSPGSLTRFMPDDIPGVTSPMIYIGMLFSWFAWHVEDHELHSLNFLHMGSPKTWYAVPGEYAFDFEEVIRTGAYGGNVDQLAALSLLGEKTTLISPEVIVASGIPCCRLIQNPGEFVVTFPRAYHIGFSHGFNCGEAANFATPQWLRFAREAAVRRAAMNYLPMLSHQQLLYLLTMSFVSRVPISLLLGARSSRLRDRQREERELLVKKAFVEDMQNENCLLSSLLGKDSSYLAVVWNPNMLPSHSNQSDSPDGAASVSNPPEENIINSSGCSSLSGELGLYVEAHDELIMANNDLFFDFQVDSGTLACVACGILGFPFMCVIQPSETASWELPLTDVILNAPHSDISQVPAGACVTIFKEGWNTSNRFRRPRIFCIEHAIEVQDLLQSKGGANLLVICHSDYQKMKAYAAVLAKETNSNFDYKEIPLNGASPADLNLIELAISDDEDDNYEDWTSRLGINLRYCVKVKKNYPLKRVQQLLTLGGLVSLGSISGSNALGVEWQSRKSRTRPRADHPQKCEPSKNLQSSGVLQKNTDSDWVKNVIQYRRRKSKLEPRDPEKVSSKDLGNDINSASLAVSSLVIEHEVQVLEASRQMASGFLPAQITNSPASTSQFVGSVEVQIINQASDGMDIDEEASTSQLQDEEERGNNSHRTYCSSLCDYEAENSGDIEIQRRNISVTEGVSDLVENTTYNSESRCSDDTQHRIGDNTQVNEILETVHSQTDVDCLEMQTAFLKEDKSPEDSASHAQANKIIDSAEKCQEAPTGACAEKEELYHDSSSVFNLRQMEEKNDDPVTKEECNETSEGTHDGHLSDIASSDDEPQEINCVMSKTGDNKLKCEFRCSQESDGNEFEVSTSQGNIELGTAESQFMTKKRRRRKGEVEMIADDKLIAVGFVRSPCEGLRPRVGRSSHVVGTEGDERPMKKVRQPLNDKLGCRDMKNMNNSSRTHSCNLEGCQMSFKTKEELSLHRRNRCPHGECGKKFSSHKYLILHQRVHEDDRPLKCPWKGCGMSFKWAWARTEHIRVHTGERPYKCKVEGCGLSFRFISDYNRHRRKTDHYIS